jgi:hypothetical protein
MLRKKLPPQRPSPKTYSHHSPPLSLVRRLVGNLDHPGLGAELQEPDPPKRLGEQVCKLILDVDVACLDAPFLQTTSDEVVPHPDVLQGGCSSCLKKQYWELFVVNMEDGYEQTLFQGRGKTMHRRRTNDRLIFHESKKRNSSMTRWILVPIREGFYKPL